MGIIAAFLAGVFGIIFGLMALGFVLGVLFNVILCGSD